MRAALLRSPPSGRFIVDATAANSEFIDNYITPVVWIDDDCAIYMYSSVAVLSYRADLVLEVDIHRRLIIECDGHDFHDRTKQQAAYDRARDRELLQIGLYTIRFTGSEIVHSPERCALEAYRCLLALRDVRRLVRCGWEDAIWLYESCGGGIEEHW